MNITLALDAQDCGEAKIHMRKPYSENLQKNPSSKAWTCAEISRPVTRDAPVSRQASATTEFSISKHLQTLERYDAPVSRKASATI